MIIMASITIQELQRGLENVHARGFAGSVDFFAGRGGLFAGHILDLDKKEEKAGCAVIARIAGNPSLNVSLENFKRGPDGIISVEVGWSDGAELDSRATVGQIKDYLSADQFFDRHALVEQVQGVVGSGREVLRVPLPMVANVIEALIS
jgi:hypothetical protein